MEKSGDVRILYPGDGNFEGSVDDLIRLAEKGWKFGSGFDPLQDTSNRAFFKEVLPLFNEKQMLLLAMLELNGSKIAAVLCFALRGRLYGYYKVYDEAHRSLSPDRVTLANAIERAFAKKFCEMDFSEGEEDFKLQWTKSSIGYTEVYLLNRRSPRYPLLLSWLAMRKKAKTTPLLKKWISRFRKS
jgi:CelD/BcsL family acetyltransferase involved in cellulose biosynthesis